MLAAVVFPALLFGAMAWWSWVRVKNETDSNIQQTVDLLGEQAKGLLQTDEMILDRVDERVAGLTWPEMLAQSGALHRYLQKIIGEVTAVDAVFLVDPEGEPQISSRSYPPAPANDSAARPEGVRDRGYFRAAVAGTRMSIDGPLRSRITGEPIFNVARRLSSEDGSFRGVAVVVISSKYLTDFWKSVTDPGDAASLVRDDGAVLARYPEPPDRPGSAPLRLSAKAMERLRAADTGRFEVSATRIEGIARIVGYRKLDNYPVYIVYAPDKASLLRQWYPTAAAFGGLAAVAAFGLLFAAAAVIRRARGEAAALEQAERTARALRGSEERYRALYDKTPVPMHAMDIHGNIIEVNDRWLELLGYERAEVIGRPVTDFHAPDSAREFWDGGWLRSVARGGVRDIQRQYVRKTGEILDVVISAEVETDENGKFLRMLDVVTDVTEQRRTEAALRQAQKMEAIGQMTGGVAHDFNNLLTVVAGNLDLAAASADQPARVRRFVGNALKAAQRGGTLTQQLLAFARRQMLHPETADPNALIGEFAQLIRQAAGEAVEVQTNLSPQLAPCRVDRVQFEASILNLVMNARDAMPRGGKITINTWNVTVSEAEAARNPEIKPGPHVLISVTDTGTGMKPEVAERAFEPFFTTKEFGQGSGLGLSMVYGFVKQSGGHVQIQSTLGVGTSVQIYLPVAADVAAEALPKPAADEPVPQGSEAILLVEDNADVRNLLGGMVRELGYDVAVAADAPEALAILRSERRIDAIFSDIIMPHGMSGDRLAREALRLRPGIKVLLTTGYAAQLADGGLLDGQFPILAKPFRRAELAVKLREVLSGSPSAAA